MCLVCKEDLKEIERLREAVTACPCPAKVRPPRAKYFSEYYQRHREKKISAAKARYQAKKMEAMK